VTMDYVMCEISGYNASLESSNEKARYNSQKYICCEHEARLILCE